MRTCHRQIGFANCLINLGDLKGFNKWIKNIQHNTKTLQSQHFESALAEIYAAKYIHMVGLEVEFNNPVKGWKSNYDLKTSYLDGKEVSVEVKCMTNEKSINPRSFLSTLEKAIRQSDDKKKKIVFIKIPEAWLNFDIFESFTLLNFAELDLIATMKKADMGILWESTELRGDIHGNYGYLRYFLSNPVLPYEHSSDFFIRIQ